jgi:7-keto-8-aminopelargonate synthetase-like enzyme
VDWGTAMLAGLSEDVADCYRRAAESHELARLATNETDREFYLARENDWLVLARSYALQQRVDLAIQEVDRAAGVTPMRPCPSCKKVTPVHYNNLFVCTNCQMIFEAE